VKAAALAGLLGAWGLPVVSVRADIVQTRTERLEGRIALRAGGLTVGEKAAATEEVLFAVFDRPGRTLRCPSTVRMADGEIWHCDILNLAAGKLTVRWPLFGQRDVDRGGIRALEFQARLGQEEESQANVLYRKNGEPLPGGLLWLNHDQIAVDSPLGAMALDRQDAARFILAGSAGKTGSAAPPPAAADEADVVLADGSVLRGRLAITRDSLTLQHATLGELTIPAAAVRSFLRRPAGVTYLTDVAFAARSSPLVQAGSPVSLVEVRLPDGSPEQAGKAIRTMVIRPETEIRVRLGGGNNVFRATVAPMARARGDARLRVLVGGKAVLDKKVSPAAEAGELISADVGGGGELVIEVTFEPAVRLPCGVVLGDPHVTAK
jgi:hypothetical protein